MRTVWNAGTAVTTTGTSTAAVCAVPAASSVQTPSALPIRTVMSAEPAFRKRSSALNVWRASNAMSTRAGIVWAVANVRSMSRRSYAVSAGSARTVWAVFATAAASARAAGSLSLCTVKSAETATALMIFAPTVTCTARNAV